MGDPGEAVPGQPFSLLCVHSGLSGQTPLVMVILRAWGPVFPGKGSQLCSGGSVALARCPVVHHPFLGGPALALGHRWGRRHPRGPRKQAGPHQELGRSPSRGDVNSSVCRGSGGAPWGGLPEVRPLWSLLLCSLATSQAGAGERALLLSLPSPLKAGPRARQGSLTVPSPGPAQTTATCRSKTTFFSTFSCLKDVHGWGWDRESRAACTHRVGGTPGPLLSDFAHFCISAHDSSFCRKGVEGASGPGISLWQLPVVASAHQDAQPLVLTSTTMASCPHGNRALSQGLLAHPDNWVSLCQATLPFQVICISVEAFAGH